MALIDRDRLLTERMKSKYYHLPNGDIAVPLIDIENAPTVDAVSVKHGRWIHHKGGYSDHYECTACGKPIVLTAKWDFCPNCGADMRGEHEKAD